MLKIKKKYKSLLFICLIILIFMFILKYIFSKYSIIDLFTEENITEPNTIISTEPNTINTTSNETNNIIKQESAVFLSHIMIGDNITNIGAVNFLSKYYNTIYFICKDCYVENLNIIFSNKIMNKNIVLAPVSLNNELENCKTKIAEFMKTDSIDIFIAGNMYTPYLKSRITHPKLLTYVQNDNGYTMEWYWIHDFYYDIGLDLSIYYDYFHMDSTKESKEHFENIKNYNIIFLHTKSSSEELSLKHIIDKFINIPEAIIICANKNVYENSDTKYELANKYINLLVPYYLDIIYNAFEIHVVNSCFACIVHPLNVTKKLKAQSVNIYDRTQPI